MRIYWDAQRTLADEEARKRREAALAAAEAAREANDKECQPEEN
jgi:hypothetical protein